MLKLDKGHYQIAPDVTVYRDPRRDQRGGWVAVIGRHVVRGCANRAQAIQICREQIARQTEA